MQKCCELNIKKHLTRYKYTQTFPLRDGAGEGTHHERPLLFVNIILTRQLAGDPYL
jgi:hypothetical protein